MGRRFPGQGAKGVKVLSDIPCSQHSQAPTCSQPRYLTWVEDYTTRGEEEEEEG